MEEDANKQVRFVSKLLILDVLTDLIVPAICAAKLMQNKLLSIATVDQTNALS